MNTYVPRQAEVRHDWWIVDAGGLSLGRLAAAVASRLRGKHKPSFTPFLDIGDHIVVVNAGKVVLTGRKVSDKMYRRHSQYPGGLTEIPAGEMRTKYPERLIERAVWGMLPKGPLGRRMIRKLKVYSGADHPHAAQQPRVLELPHAARRD